ncbi:hypothetical protein HAZT_HAZT005847 [Hyalella azteca]|uniref:arginine kinase n=2 Tax=Hyalella azteca TaxID=294128 RepID=A0A6A0H8S9_HYAAZ|nr:hypothetical protein HAZT_HAZT005847 [Hyalella azteca]
MLDWSWENVEDIHAAAEAGETRRVQTLIDRRKKASVRDTNHCNILHKAVLHGHSDLVRHLVQSYPELLDQQDRAGRTPLHYAAVLRDGGHTYKILDKAGADASLEDKYVENPDSITEKELRAELKEGIPLTDDESPPRKHRDAFTDARHDTKDTDEIHGGGQGGGLKTADSRTQSLIDKAFKDLRNQKSTSLLRKHLSPSLFDKIKHRVTPNGASLLDIIKLGVSNPEDNIGVTAADAESYSVFDELFDPIIRDYHDIGHRRLVNPQVNFGSADIVGDFDDFGNYVVSTRIRCARNIEGYCFTPLMTKAQFSTLEKEIVPVLNSLDGPLQGEYEPVDHLSGEKAKKMLKQFSESANEVCPTNVGSAMRSSVRIRLPCLSKQHNMLEETAEKLNLQVQRVKDDPSDDNKGLYDLSYRWTLGNTEEESIVDMYSGILEIISLEKRFENSKVTYYGSEEEGMEKVDSRTLGLIEKAYASLKAENSQSLLKKHLTLEIFEKIKHRITNNGGTLLDVIKSGVTNPTSSVGVYAPDAESYTLFKDLFDPIIEEYHEVQGPKIQHPPQNFGSAYSLGNFDDFGQYVVSTRVRCARNLEGYPFNPLLTRDQYEEIEQDIVNALDSLDDDLAGYYKPLNSFTDEENAKLVASHLLFKSGDPFLEAANACRFWPNGRGIFLNSDASLVVWVNEEDQMRIISMQSGGDLAVVYDRFVRAVTALGDILPFSHSSKLGYLSFCPTNLGTAVRASVHIKLPNLMKNSSLLEETADKFNLQVRGSQGEHSEVEGGVFDISNRRRLGLTEIDAMVEMYHGVSAIISMEQQLEEAIKRKREKSLR